ncbi:MAG: citrate synthase [Sharpea porci]|uniref:citrate synthase n=1 Tax=Sharpea porci TaxID=2652286 RepID=UPI002409693D|nr:citrate synthase [Sharpea porci]MDD6711817.1 citrate synthase [Sharpea porci]
MSEFVKKSLKKSLEDESIKNELYKEYSVKKGLRNEDGTGVLVGLTRISDVVGYRKVDGKKIDDYGKLYYRGILVSDIVSKSEGRRYMFEEVCFLILFGHLPNRQELEIFKNIIAHRYELPDRYLEHSILNFPSKNLMNKLQQEVLMMYRYDKYDPDSRDTWDLIEKGINLIAKIPVIVCYTYATKIHNFDNASLVIHHIDPNLSIAEQILYLLRPDGKYTKQEAEVLDRCLLLHADHGGGNNSTFTSVVISSTGTDLYSAISGSIGSLKGPRHGGANLAVRKQMLAAIDEIGIDADDRTIRKLIKRIMDKDFNDNSGLVYGIGHAVYTLSDPRAEILEKKCGELAIEKGRHDEFLFYKRFAKEAIAEIHERKGINVCANVDFYTGLIYDILGIPEDLYTLLFVIGRTVGWVAHIIEDQLYSNRIVRPATKYVGSIRPYIPLDDRE